VLFTYVSYILVYGVADKLYVWWRGETERRIN